MPTLLSFGHGYSSAALSRRLLPLGWKVIGTTRSAEKAERLKDEGIHPLIWPGDDLSAAFSEATHILTSVAPTEEGDPVLAAVSDQIAKEAAHIQWVAYLSTTSVYGDHKGGWVDESTPVNPLGKRGKARALAEANWEALAKRAGLPLHIFRLAGIYGPGRGPFAKVRAGTARRIVKPNQFFSRIHVEDIAAVLEASITRPNPDAIYNVCDDSPSPPEDVIAYAAELLGLPVPPAVSWDAADMSQMARGFYSESKRVRNTRIKDELGVVLNYPDYRIGLKALLEDQTSVH